MTTTDDLLAANAEVEFLDIEDPKPARRVAIVTCMDARLDVYGLFGLEPGDAHVIRNAGGVVTDDVERSVLVSQRALGTVEVMVVHHSGCGMEGAGFDAGTPWPMGFFADAADDVRAGVARLRGSSYLLHTDAIRGFVLDTHTGRAHEIS